MATWNIWWRHGPWEQRQPAIVETLRRVDADVVGLQEVCLREPDQPTALRAAFPEHHLVVAPGGNDGRFTVVNAILSRWPVLDSDAMFLDVGELPPHRTALWARLDAPFGPLDVWCTHLSHGFDQSALRQRQLGQIARRMAERRGDPTTGFPPVLLGDLNAVPDSDEIRSLTGRSASYADRFVASDVWEQVGHGSGVTYTERNPYVNDSAWPERRLDYVFVGWPRPRPVGNPVTAALFGDEPIDGVTPSDHWGVAVDLVASVGA